MVILTCSTLLLSAYVCAITRLLCAVTIPEYTNWLSYVVVCISRVNQCMYSIFVVMADLAVVFSMHEIYF